MRAAELGEVLKFRAGREKTMSRLFGPMRQVGIVVRDIERPMRHW
jgi:hypothetical protein